MNDKYLSLQILRAIAAWMVVFHHYMQIFYNFDSSTPLGFFFSRYGSFGVDIFFVLSGFVMYFSAGKKRVPAEEFFINRVFRVVPAYWFYTFCLILLIGIFPTEFAFTSYNLESLLASLFFYPSENPSGIGTFPLLTVGWSLNFEMMFYLILSLSIFISQSRALIICFAALLILPPVFPKDLPFSSILGSKYLHEFLMGFVVAYIVGQGYLEKLKNKNGLATILFLVIGIAVQVKSKKLACLFILLSFVTWESFINKDNFFVKAFVTLGDYSYSTYLLHVLVLGVFLHWVGVRESNIETALILVAISLSILLLSKLSFSFIERNSYIERVKRALLRTKRTE